MAEYTSPQVASIASDILAGRPYTTQQALAVLASGLTQARNHTLPGLAALNASYGWDEYTSERIAEIAGRGLNDLRLITSGELRAVAASVLTQAPNRAPGAHALYGAIR